MKKYNNQTKGYKIDIFVKGNYYSSTDQSKTCKSAKENFLRLFPTVNAKDVIARFDNN